MNQGFFWSSMTTMIIGFVILMIVIPMDRRYVVRKKEKYFKKIDYAKTTIYLKWTAFDTLTLLLASYTIACTSILNYMISKGMTIERSDVQFLIGQTQTWTVVTLVYFLFRLTVTLKSIEAQRNSKEYEDDA